MRIGLITQLHGRPGGDTPPPTWSSIRERALLAEDVGFDMFVYEDVLMYRGEEATDGVWESVAISAAVAEATSTLSFGQSVINSPYRSPAMTVSIAETLNEISGGRYVLGIGAGNSPTSDYEGFGFATDKRYSRFAEAIEIIHSLARTGSVDFQGDFYSAKEGEIILRGPSDLWINVAAGGPKMLDLVAQYADAWNWWAWDETIEQCSARLLPILERLNDACMTQGREPESLERTLDVYSIIAPGLEADTGMDNPIRGSAPEIASAIGALGSLGIDEVRCDVFPKTPAGIEAMAPVVAMVHDL